MTLVPLTSVYDPEPEYDQKVEPLCVPLPEAPFPTSLLAVMLSHCLAFST
jgi:hypothetical protein